MRGGQRSPFFGPCSCCGCYPKSNIATSNVLLFCRAEWESKEAFMKHLKGDPGRRMFKRWCEVRHGLTAKLCHSMCGPPDLAGPGQSWLPVHAKQCDGKTEVRRAHIWTTQLRILVILMHPDAGCESGQQHHCAAGAPEPHRRPHC